MLSSRQRLHGCLLGTLVGDALGLPAEGLSAARIARRFPGPLRHRLAFGRSCGSDDTDHAVLSAQAWAGCGDDPARFARRLAWRLRGWLASAPPGVGLATARAGLKLWLGWSPARAGVVSAGNGPAMRAPILGAMLADRPERRREAVLISTNLTHRHPDAEAGALWLAAWAAAWMHGEEPDVPAIAAASGGAHPVWRELPNLLAAPDAQAWAAEVCPRGVSGWICHSVPAVLMVLAAHRDEPAQALDLLFRLGGDTDSTMALAGGLLGLRHGPDCWPEAWTSRLVNPPLGLPALERLAATLAEGRPGPWAWWALPLKHLALLPIVLGHGLRRMLP